MDFSVVDIIIIIVLAICIIKGLAEGFLRTFMSFFLVIGSFILARLLVPIVGENFAYESKLYSSLYKNIYEKFDGISVSSSTTVNNIIESSNNMNAPNSLKNFISNLLEQSNQTIGEFTHSFAEASTIFVLDFIILIILFIIFLIVGQILISIICKISELPVINSFNKLGGMLLGLIKGSFYIVIVSSLMYYCNIFFQVEILSKLINNSMLIKYFFIGNIF